MEYQYRKKDFKKFVSSCKFWIDKFGITEWDIEFKHHKIDSVARTTYNCSAKIACFQLTTNGEGDFLLQNDLHKLALHEVLHLLLADFGNAIDKTKDFEHDLVIAHEHAIVMRLLKAILN